MINLISTMIILTAIETGIPPYFALAIAYEENWSLNPKAIHINPNGSSDLGVMQLNSSWYNGNWQDPKENITAGCRKIKELIDMPQTTTYWSVAICYNAGPRWLTRNEKPPDSSIDYATRVIARWNNLTGGRALTIINNKARGNS